LELSFPERIASASSLADFEMMSPFASGAASAEPINEVRAAAAAAPASATVVRKSRRPIFSLIYNPIFHPSLRYDAQLILF
jgi:hypothetical protein